MNLARRFTFGDWLALLIVFAAALAARAGYLAAATDYGRQDPPIAVQGESLDVERFGWFGSPAPLTKPEEVSAHIAPAYPWLFDTLARFDVPAAMAMRWLQCALGTITSLLYFLFARRAFGNTLVAFLAGALTAVHPFWIAGVAELSDGVLAAFLLASVLCFGARAGEIGGAFTSLLFGLCLAGLAMVRAALLPFTFAGLLWFLWRCRSLKAGWFCALLALLGFGNGLAPWTVRNFQAFGEPVPVADSAFVHLWIGNQPGAGRADFDETNIRVLLPPERVTALLNEPNQARRYGMLGREVLGDVEKNPGAWISRRLWEGLAFLFGESWLTNRRMSELRPGASADGAASDGAGWFVEHREALLQGSFLVMILSAALGWRFSSGWRRDGRLAAIAVVWIPLPYLLAHGAWLSGPRFPLDGVLLCFGAYALACLWPGTLREPVEET